MRRIKAYVLPATIVIRILCEGLSAQEAKANTNIWREAANGDLQAVREYLQAGKDVNAREPSTGITPLMAAAITGRAKIARVLLAKGAAPSLRDRTGSTALHMAAFFGHLKIVKRLLAKGAEVNARNNRSETPFDVVKDPWSPELERIYQAIGSALKLKLNLEKIKKVRPEIARFLVQHGGKSARPAVRATRYRGAYYMNGRIYVHTFGTPEGEPLTSGHWDFKPSWSRTGDMLVFFRRLKNDPVVTNWKTAVCIIKVDGSGFHRLTDATLTESASTSWQARWEPSPARSIP